MTTFVVHSQGGDPLVRMEAEYADRVPTKVEPVGAENADLAKYAAGLVKNFGDQATVQAISTRMGNYASLHTEDGGEVSKQHFSDVLGERFSKARRLDDDEDLISVEKTEDDSIDLMADGNIAKTDEEQRIVFGWAYVTHDQTGNVNVDKSGDFIDAVEEIEKSAYDYVLSSRKGDADHTNVQSGRLVESIVFTPEKIEKMGLPAGSVPNGWWLGFKVDDDATWDRVKKGELRAFSIHGKGTRNKVAD